MYIDPNAPYLMFFDLDGTLLFSGCGIEDEVRKALAEAKQRGHRIILNTGRSKAFLPEIAYSIEWDGMICGTSYVEYHGDILLNHPVPTEDLMKVTQYCVEQGLPLRLEGITQMFTTASRDPFPNVTETYREVLAGVHDISKMTVLSTITDEQAAYFAESFDPVRLPTYTEVLQRNLTKGTGIQIIADKEKIPLSRTVAFGDSLNDRGMLECAGIRVLMKHAPIELDVLCDIRATEETTGVAEVIRKYFIASEKV